MELKRALVAASGMLLLWGIIVSGAHDGSGAVQVLDALAMRLFARRIIVGAPRFLS